MENTEALIREGKRKLLSLSHGVQAAAEWKQLSGLMDHYDTRAIQNQAPEEVRSVLFVITRLVRFGGGQTSILRLGTELCRQGYQVGYAVYKAQSREEMEFCAKANLPEFQGTLYTRAELAAMVKHPEQQPDVVFASSWDTVYYVKKFKTYRMYFVQDYEPYFYPFGDKYLLTKKTYEQGLHMVSLGVWNCGKIQQECSIVSPLDEISFPCEVREYQYTERDFAVYRDKKTLTIAVYLKYYGKRLPNILQYMLTHLKEEFLKRDEIQLQVLYYGEAKSFIPKGGTNLGQLNREALSELYRSADFGMTASLSNISLVPFEMAAAGLPLVEFADGTCSSFFPEDTCILTSIDYRELYQKLKESLQQPEQLQKRCERARDYVETLSWEKTAGQLAELLQGITGTVPVI